MSESSFLPPPSDDAGPLTGPAPAILVGATSPLWGYFMGAAASGVAWWWMTRWAEPANLDAMFGAAERAAARAFEDIDTAPDLVVDAAALTASSAEALVAKVEEAADQATQAANDAAAEVTEVTAAVVEAPEAAALATVQPVLPPEAVGGEAAPISPLVEAASPKSRSKPEDPAPTVA